MEWFELLVSTSISLLGLPAFNSTLKRGRREYQCNIFFSYNFFLSILSVLYKKFSPLNQRYYSKRSFNLSVLGRGGLHRAVDRFQVQLTFVNKKLSASLCGQKLIHSMVVQKLYYCCRLLQYSHRKDIYFPLFHLGVTNILSSSGKGQSIKKITLILKLPFD